jgi:uncharacterized phage protein gp47/JayE
MANIYGPILPLQLDGRNLTELVRAIQSRINLESGGSLTDFTPASPLSSITEGQAFAQAELSYYLNNLPEAFSLQWFRQLGVQRIVGSRSVVSVTFTPTPGYQGSIIIPQGTRLFTESNLVFILTENVSIESGSLGVAGIARSERWGSVYNVGAGEINRADGRFLGLGTVTNDQAASGGRDLETIDQMKTRAFELMARRNLTTANDFEGELRAIAPDAQVVKVLTYEERFDLVPQDFGGVFIVAGGEDGSPLSEASKSSVTAALKNRVVLGTSVSILSPIVVPLDVVIDIYYDPANLNLSLDSQAQSLFDSLNEYFSPSTLQMGNNLLYQDALKYVYSSGEFISSINNFDIKLMIIDPDEIEGPCAGFSGEESIDETECLYNYTATVNSENQFYLTPNKITTYKLWRCSISLTSNKTFSSTTFTYRDLYTPVAS